jgi:hypothetical protein
MFVAGVTAKMFVEENWGNLTLAAPAVARVITQTNDTVYNANAIDGSEITDVEIVDGDLLVNVDGGSITWADLYAYETYWLYTEAGIIDEGRFTVAVDTANYKWYNFKLNNVGETPLVVSGGYGVDGDTGESIDMLDDSGGTIVLAPDHVVAKIVTVSGENIITGDIADINIPTATDNASATWDSLTADHTTAGSFGVFVKGLLSIAKFLGLKDS